jgi:serine/threonine protein kinase
MFRELTQHEYTKINKPLGKGAFSIVYTGTYNEHVPVPESNLHAIIRHPAAIKFTLLNKTSLHTFQNEIAMIKHIQLYKSEDIRSDYILTYYGYTNYALVMALANKQTLREWVFVTNSFDWNDAYIIKEIADGLSYLHDSCKIIHRDIKTENIFLSTIDNKPHVKIGDFGLASTIQKPNTDAEGTTPYIAPEIIQRTSVSTACDIYSFGIILLELAQKQEIDAIYVALLSLENEDIDTQINCIENFVKSGQRPHIPQEPLKIAHLISWCVRHNPLERPTAMKISQELETPLTEISAELLTYKLN